MHMGWLWAPNPSFGKSSTVICFIIMNLLGKRFEVKKTFKNNYIFILLCLSKLFKLVEALRLL